MANVVTAIGQWLNSAKGKIIAPKTLTKYVFDENGKSVEERFTLINTDAGNTIDVTLNKETYEMTVILKNKNGEELSSKTVDFPMETAFVNANYDKNNKKMLFTLESGVVVEVPLGDLIEGLVSQTDFDLTVNNINSKINEINSNLDTLEFGEIAGGKNLFKYNEVSGTLSKTVECSLDAGTYTISALVNSSDTDSSKSLIDFYYEDGSNESYLLGRESRTSYTVTLTKHVIGLIFYASKDWVNSANDTFTYSDIQIEKGTTATDYEPYIPSVKMLAEEVSAQNESLEAQGLDNKFDGILFQGFFDTNGTEGNPTQSDTCVVSKNPINVSDGDIINVKYSGKETTILFAQFYKSDGSNNGIVMMENGSNIDSTFEVRAGTKTMHINIGNSGGISINDVSSLYVSVNNEIVELNSNLDDLVYGERSGNKNLLDVSKIKGMSGVVKYGDYGFNNITTDTRTESVPFINLYVGNTLVAGGKNLTKTPSSGIVKAYETFTTDKPINRINIGHSGAVNNCTVLFNMNLPAGTYTISMDIVKDNPSIVGGFEFKNIQIEEGTTATPYEPYIPSVKMLTEENTQQSSEMMDIKMLGWSVPKECPIQNEVNENQFVQKVGRIKFEDLQILDTYAYGTRIRFYPIPAAKKEWQRVFYMDGYKPETPKDYDGWNDADDKTIGWLSTYEYIIIRDDSCTSQADFEKKLSGKYMYYKLYSSITMTIDGNEVTERVNDSLVGLENDCLTLQNTSLKNGVYLGDTGNFSDRNDFKCSSEYYEITPNTPIKLELNTDNDDWALLFYDENKTYLGRSNSVFALSGKSIETTTPPNAKYATFNIHLYNGNFPIPKLYITKIGRVVSSINESLDALGKCKNLLKPTLQTTTQNSVTCTNNGDGTYTLNGTASELTTFILRDMKLDSSLSYKLTGCPLGGDWDNGYSMYVEKQYWGVDVGKGYEITLTDASNLCGVYIRIIKGTVCNNLVFKPMITTDLSATYDDFVPYTGDGDTLTHDVAELKNDLGGVVNKFLWGNSNKKSFTIKNLTEYSQEFIINTIYRAGAGETEGSDCDGYIIIHKESITGIKFLKVYGASGITASYDTTANEITLTSTKAYISLYIQSNSSFDLV